MGYGRINAYEALKYTIENYGGPIGGSGKTVTFHEDISIESGVTLTIASGTTVKVAANKKITVKGTLDANNVEFRCASSQAEWGGFVFDGSSCSASDLVDCEITEVTNGIEVKGTTARPTIEECYIEADYYPIYVTNSASPKIINCHLYSSENHAVHIVNGNGDFTECEFRVGDGQNDNPAVYVSGSTSTPDFYEKFGDVGNLFDFDEIDGEGAVLAGGSPEFGDDPILGLNDFVNFSASNNYYIDNNTGSSIKAEGNWWGTTTDATISSRLDGTVDFTPKESSANSAGPDWSVSKAAIDPFADGFEAYSNEQYENALDALYDAFTQNKNHERAGNALFKIGSSAYFLGVLDEYKELMQDNITSEYPEVAHQAKNWLSLLHAENGKIAEADNIISAIKPGTLSQRELMLQMISYYQAYNLKSDAERIAASLKMNFPNDKKLEYDVKVMMEHPFAFQNKVDGLSKQTSSEQDVPTMKLSVRPNPFNPSTTIQFHLVEDGNATLQIFDVLGRHVQTLIDGEATEGVHSIQWDGKNSAGVKVAAGIYFARLKTGNAVKTRKLLLVK